MKKTVAGKMNVRTIRRSVEPDRTHSRRFFNGEQPARNAPDFDL